jgi:hypothetical protein
MVQGIYFSFATFLTPLTSRWSKNTKCVFFFTVYTSYNPALPFTMKFPGVSFCDGKQKLMVIATLPLTIRKVILN